MGEIGGWKKPRPATILGTSLIGQPLFYLFRAYFLPSPYKDFLRCPIPPDGTVIA